MESRTRERSVALKAMEREEGKFAQAFEIVYHHPIVKGEFWKSFFAGLVGWQYKYKSKQPLTLNNLKLLDDKVAPDEDEFLDEEAPMDNGVTSGWDTNIYNWAEFFFALVIRVPKNLFKVVTEFVWVGAYLNSEPGSYLTYVPLALAKIGQTFTSPITAVWETAEGTFKRLEHGSSWVDETLGILGTVLHVLLATCVATAYLILTATVLFSLLHAVGLGGVVVASVNVANYLGSISFLGQLGSLFISLVAKVGALFGLNFVTSGLLPAISMACSLLTLIVPLAGVRWLLRRTLDISPLIEWVRNFFTKKVPPVKAEAAQLPHPAAPVPESKRGDPNPPSSPVGAGPSELLVEHLGGEHKEPIEDSIQGSFTIIPKFKVIPGKPIIIDPTKPMEVKLFTRGKGKIFPDDKGNIDPNIILSIDGKTFSLRRNLRSTTVLGGGQKVTRGDSSTLDIGSRLAASGLPDGTVLFSHQTIPGSNTAPLVEIKDNNPIGIQFLPKSSSATASGAAQSTVLSIGGQHNLELDVPFDQIMTALSSLSASKVLAAAAAAAPPPGNGRGFTGIAAPSGPPKVAQPRPEPPTRSSLGDRPTPVSEGQMGARFKIRS